MLIDDTQILRWSNGSCGNPGCTDPECCCAVCGRPIGTSEEVLQQSGHDPDCGGCEMCKDQVPFILFRGEGELMVQAAFHDACFRKVLIDEKD